MKTRLFDRAAPALLALSLSGAVVVPALAQNTGATGGGGMPPPPGAAGTPETPPSTAPGAQGATSEAARVQQRVDRLRSKLKITPAQEQVWNQFAEVMRSNAEQINQLYEDRAGHFQSMNAVDGLKNYQHIVQVQADNLGKLAAAFQTLYDALSPEQKQTADQLFRYQEERREQRHMAHTGAPR